MPESKQLEFDSLEDLTDFRDVLPEVLIQTWLEEKLELTDKNAA